VPRITDFCSCIYVFGCKLSLVRLCDSDFGITPIGDITIGITCAVFCFHIAHISFDSPWYLFCLSVIVLARLCVFGTAMSIRNGVLCFLTHKCYVRSIKRYCFVRKYAAIPAQLEIFILQYIGWCVLIMWTFIINQFICFCQFLMDNLASPSCLFTYSVCAHMLQ
jgi:hypothetical protein